MNTKGALAWETIGKLLIGLLLLIVIIALIYGMQGQFGVLLAKAKALMRFGI